RSAQPRPPYAPRVFVEGSRGRRGRRRSIDRGMRVAMCTPMRKFTRLTNIGWQVVLPVLGVSACVSAASDQSASDQSAASGARPPGGPAIAAAAAKASFSEFESGQVRPLALSPSGKRLFAVNTPDGRLEIFTSDDGKLTPSGSISVGVEPVAVAARTESEVWVVNHLSDSVSVVTIGEDGSSRVTRTLFVGDEPRDI